MQSGMTRPELIRFHPGNGSRMKKLGGRKQVAILIGLGMSMTIGLVVYLRLWTIDYRISSDETELIRRQFDLANREAMDESAYWRGRYDAEVEKVNSCQKELLQVKWSSSSNGDGKNSKSDSLQKENKDLLEKIGYLKQELGCEKLNCSMKKP
ncbi:unnamed protein product [Cuscuta epithymum]|uniref:Uncharacterized protein n=1 Tax=Cuscuta epithymum TaxID=186058 RepID=A0AAV0C549_9ASTE|nr:unnamed protein product [Cuscuta epithymum]CAH9135605.1 unnamed protein product [Cuscuta epithymum]